MLDQIFYVTIKHEPKPVLPTYLQMLNHEIPKQPYYAPNSTMTYRRDSEASQFKKDFDKETFIDLLELFRTHNDSLYTVDRHSLYFTFPVPKKNGGTRWINAPNEQLKTALRDLKKTFELFVGTTFHHDSAYAYVKGRCPVNAVKRHQYNESNWFAKYDFSDFFGSVTLDFTISMCEHIYPLNEVCETERGKTALRNALELAFLDGGLPQGTPVSPWITNFIMIPFDYIFSAWCNKYTPHFCYTRYADDIDVSCTRDFNYRKVEEKINSILHSIGAPMRMNSEKTHYGSRAGHNYILGVCLNKDNNITLGHKKKKYFEATLTNYAQSYRTWSIDDVYKLQGIISYYKSVEPECIERIITEYNNKFGIDIPLTIKLQLKGEL